MSQQGEYNLYFNENLEAKLIDTCKTLSAESQFWEKYVREAFSCFYYTLEEFKDDDKIGIYYQKISENIRERIVDIATPIKNSNSYLRLNLASYILPENSEFSVFLMIEDSTRFNNYKKSEPKANAMLTVPENILRIKFKEAEGKIDGYGAASENQIYQFMLEAVHSNLCTKLAKVNEKYGNLFKIQARSNYNPN